MLNYKMHLLTFKQENVQYKFPLLQVMTENICSAAL